MTYILRVVSVTGDLVRTPFLPLDIACEMARRAIKSGCEQAVVCDQNGELAYELYAGA